MYTEGTIIALSSPPGSGAISIIRLSGKDAIATTDKIFKSNSNKPLSKLEGQSLTSVSYTHLTLPTICSV